jgi:hypothetical protein
VLPEVALDRLLELHEAFAMLVILAHQESLPSLVLELELQADILGCPNQSIVGEGLLVEMDLHVLEHGNNLGLLTGREELLLPWRLLHLR